MNAAVEGGEVLTGCSPVFICILTALLLDKALFFVT